MNLMSDNPIEVNGLQSGAFAGRDTFRQCVRDVLALAASQQWPEIILSDPDFADWPLGEQVVAQNLNEWSKTGRSLTLLASQYELVQARHARFVDWRKRWSHIVNCRRLSSRNGTGIAAVPSVVWTPDWVVQRTAIEKCIGVCTQSLWRRTEIRETLDNSLKQSSPGFAASVLGL